MFSGRNKMKLSFKIKTAALTTVLIAAVTALSLSGLLLTGRSVTDSNTQRELIKAVERNVDEIEYKNGIFEIEEDFAFFSGGVYCDVYSDTFEFIDGETPKQLAVSDEFSAGEIKKRNIDGKEYYIYDTRLDFIKYEYEIDVISGKILKYEADVAEKDTLEATAYSPIHFDSGISSDEAVAVALEHAGISREEANILSVKLPAYSNRQVFSVRFVCEEPLYPSVWVRGIYSADTAKSTFGTLERIIIYLLPVLLILAAAGSYILAKRTIRPVERITDSAREINSGSDLSRRIEIPDASAEIRDLTLTFNGMLERLEDSFETEKRFSSDASHELRTPLAVIKAECEYALGENADEQDRLEALNCVNEQNEKMARLVNALLAVSRAEQGRIKRESVNFSELAKELCASYKTEKGITLKCEIQDGIIINADRMLIIRVLENLVSNSIRYGKESGETLVTLKKENGNAVLEVKDNGTGISQQDLPKIWDRFFRADASRSSEGFGLGLSLVKQIVKLHDGSIQAESKLGEGSIFTVSIPTIE